MLLIRVLFVCFLVFSTSFSFASKSQITNYSNELTKAMHLIHKFPEARQLILEIQNDGEIQVLANRHSRLPFEALWDPTRRSIVVDLSMHDSEGALVRSIIFEMHNALTNKRHSDLDQHAYQGTMSRDEYVKQVEYVEYKNCLDTKKLLKKGIQAGVFPKDSSWDSVPDTFEEHFYLQQQFGHSQYIAESYDHLRG
ncbi:hypothetical protein N9Y92_02785 [Chlamydiales bacterium]|nr:hypothetical protein [Chlamydiales bacterium]